MSMRYYFSILLLLISTSLPAASNKAVVLEISGTINPATQDYFVRGLSHAVKEQADVVILKLNTPGGLESAMRGINEAIITSPIPVITYVTPAGARAASAGTYIMYASHLAAMAPGTNIGAASPIQLTEAILPGKNQTEKLSTSEQKTLNDSAAYMRSLAQLRGRNADWADLSVRKAASISAEEAKHLKVIDETAKDMPELLNKIDGHTAMVLGNSEAVKTKNLELIETPPDWRYQFLAFITNPNIVYILMLIAIYGLFFEFSNPGLILPGVAGVIALLLMLYAFQLMPINYAGLTLLLTGITFMLMEIYISSFGILGIGGIIAFIIGSIMLFNVYDPHYRIDWSLISMMSIFTIAFFFMVITLAIRSHRNKILTGKEGLIGSVGTVIATNHNHIKVLVLGEIWDARSQEKLSLNQQIEVEKLENFQLIVKAKQQRRNDS
jgi:membrane-bound serine protease (ClpP class)